MSYLKMPKLVVSFFAFCTVILFFSCNKGKQEVCPPTTKRTVKKLNGYTPLEIAKSRMVCGNDTTIVDHVSLASAANDQMYVVFYFDETETEFLGLLVPRIAVLGDDSSPEDFLPNSMYAKVESGEYIAENILPTYLDDDDVVSFLAVLTSASGFKSVELLINPISLFIGSSKITIDGDVAKINGELGDVTYNQILDLNHNHPEVITLLLEDIGGSVNDGVNIMTGRLIREAGYKTWVNTESRVYSGGVDLFVAGKIRQIDAGSELGVHSWCCGPDGEDGAEIPASDTSQHQGFINYSIEMLGEDVGEDCYWFFINSAPSEEIHLLTEDEIEQYHIRKE